jgi:hypothetical protein
MTERKAWFLVMSPQDANRPNSQWVRLAAASRAKIVAMPIAPQGWLVLAGFVLLLIAAGFAIWQWGFATGRLPLVAALLLTLIAVTALVLALIWIIRLRMRRLPPF